MNCDVIEEINKISVNISLVLSSKIIERSVEPAALLKNVFALKCFDRCEIFLRNSSGVAYKDSLETLNKIRQCISVIRNDDVGLLLTVAMHQRQNNTNKEICAFEATNNGRVPVLSRICPRSEYVVSDLKSFYEEAYYVLGLTSVDKIVLSYFRYENFRQCVCDNCIDAFAEYMKENGVVFQYKNIMSLVDENIIMYWVLWRRRSLLEKVKTISNLLKSSGVVEIDFDQTKRYLGGVLIEEGLDYDRLIEYFCEIYLHIEPAMYIKNKFIDGRNNRMISYINHLRYLRSVAAEKSVDLTPFFWFLSNRKLIESNFKSYYNLTRDAGFTRMALYTEDPILLAGYMRNGYVFS